MLLIVTERGDFHADWMVLELERRGDAFVRFNTEDYPQTVRLRWRSDADASLVIRGRDVSLGDVSAVWYRRPVPPRLPNDLSPAAARWASGEAREALLGAWRTMGEALWVNHPDRNRVAESKPGQLRAAQDVGFEVPATLITNDADAVAAFVEERPGGVICKPLYDGRLATGQGEQVFFTSRVAPGTALAGMGPEPYLFQALVPKRYDVRATVIGDEVLAARIDSQGGRDTETDWRRGQPGALPHAIEELPDDIAEGCLALCRHYQLKFAAIDLARRPDGGYSFFEVNPNGQWAWIEQRTGLPLAARLADLLLEARVGV